MTSFVHVDQPTVHPGVARAEAAFDQIRSARLNTVGASGLAALLLSAIVMSLLVGMDNLATSVDEGDLLVGWLVMWAVAFVVLALCANTVRSFAERATVGWRAHAERRVAARADAQFLAYARLDSRSMQDLQAAASRHEAEQDALSVPVREQAQALMAQRSAEMKTPTLYEAMRRVNLGKYY